MGGFVRSWLAALAGPMQLAKRAFERCNFPFVIDLLSLGKFKGFQDLLHFIEGAPQFIDDFVDLFDGLGDGGNLGAGLAFARGLAFACGLAFARGLWFVVTVFACGFGVR